MTDWDSIMIIHSIINTLDNRAFNFQIGYKYAVVSSNTVSFSSSTVKRFHISASAATTEEAVMITIRDFFRWYEIKYKLI